MLDSAFSGDSVLLGINGNFGQGPLLAAYSEKINEPNLRVDYIVFSQPGELHLHQIYCHPTLPLKSQGKQWKFQRQLTGSCVLQHTLHPSHSAVSRTWSEWDTFFCISGGNQFATKGYVHLVLLQNGIKMHLQRTLKPGAPKLFLIYLYSQKQSWLCSCLSCLHGPIPILVQNADKIWKDYISCGFPHPKLLLCPPCSQKLDLLLSNSNLGGHSSLKKLLKKKQRRRKKVSRQQNWKLISLK